MNLNSTNSTQTTCHLIFPIAAILTPVICIFGFVLNGISAIIFMKIILNKTTIIIPRLFYFLACKSIIDTVMFTFQTFLPAYFGSGKISRLLIVQIWFIYDFNYLTDVFAVCSAALEICVLLDIKFANSNANRRLKPRSFILLLVSMFIVCGLFSLVNVFRFELFFIFLLVVF